MNNHLHKEDNKKLAFRATLHCVAGCGLGDTAGLVIGTSLGWSVLPTMVLAITLGFAFGYSFTIIPLLKAGSNLKDATKIAVVGETASIAVMETAENVTAFLIPGLLVASFTAPLFWIGFLIAVAAGFIAAYPVNYFMISRNVRGAHSHH